MFNQDIKRTIGMVLKANHYKLGRPSLGEGCVYYIKRYSQKLGFYIGCRDNRPHNGPITIDMYFTGIMQPDDRLMNFFPGIHVKIFEVYHRNVTDELILAAGKKIVAIEKHIASAAETVLNELVHPFFVGKEYPLLKVLMYSETLCVYDALKNDETTKNEFGLLEKNCYEAFRKKENEKTVDLCSEFLKKLPPDYFMKRGVYLEDIKQLLADHLVDYIGAQDTFGYSKGQKIVDVFPNQANSGEREREDFRKRL